MSWGKKVSLRRNVYKAPIFMHTEYISSQKDNYEMEKLHNNADVCGIPDKTKKKEVVKLTLLQTPLKATLVPSGIA